jgi:hypothetical protein
MNFKCFCHGFVQDIILVQKLIFKCLTVQTRYKNLE